jgi:hypothetical protein
LPSTFKEAMLIMLNTFYGKPIFARST